VKTPDPAPGAPVARPTATEGWVLEEPTVLPCGCAATWYLVADLYGTEWLAVAAHREGCGSRWPW